jgi:N-acetylneuraminate synthase
MVCSSLDIDGREVGPGRPCFVIAEAGVNHNGSPELAHQLVDVAAEAGADAIKFQTFCAERLVTRSAPKAQYQVQNDASQESQFDMLRRLELTRELHQDLITHARHRGILFFSTPFDEESADLLEEVGVSLFKVPSGEITNLSLLAHLAAKGKPMIVSTGMATLGEIETALDAIVAAGTSPVVLLHCVSRYPADAVDVNLRAMSTLAAAFHVPVGYSDHTLGLEVPFAAVALGACVIEKHFTLDRSLSGPDHRASAEPEELAALVHGIRVIEQALGDGRKRPAASEAETAAVARKSLVVACDLEPGAVFTPQVVAVKRPGTGLPPVLRTHILGRRARVPISAGTVLTWDMVA